MIRGGRDRGQKGNNSDTQCSQCQAAVETLEHVVLNCSDTIPISQQRAFFAQTSQHKLATFLYACFDLWNTPAISDPSS